MTHPLPPTPSPTPSHEPSPTGLEAGPLALMGEDDLRRVLDAMPIIVWWKDRDGLMRGMNQTYLDRVIGPPSKVLGRSDEELFGDTPETADYKACDQKVLTTEQPMLNLEESVRSDNGDVVTLLTSKVPLHDAAGAVQGVLGVAVDISGQKTIRDELTKLQRSAEAALEREHRQGNLLRGVLEAIPHCVFWKDVDLTYRGCNQNFADVGGHDSTAAVVGKTDFDMPWTREEAEFYRRVDREVMARGVPILNIEESQQHANGQETTLLTSKVPLRDEKGEVVGILGMYADITAQKRSENERDELQRRLLETSRQAGKAEVATDVLHSVGNALNSINVSAALLAEGLEEPAVPTLQRVADTLAPHADDFAGYVAREPRAAALPGLLGELANTLTRDRAMMAREVQQLQAQLNHVKQIVASQQSFARAPGEAAPIAPDVLLDDALCIATSGRGLQGVEIQVQIAPDTPPAVIDRHLALQILVNLINNACQAAAPDGAPSAPATLVLSADHDPVLKVARYAVQDSGVGISAEHLACLFDHGFTTRADGHGFGLHSARAAAGTMGGRLEAFSDGPGTGATFVLTVPLRPAKDHDPGG